MQGRAIGESGNDSFLAGALETGRSEDLTGVICGAVEYHGGTQTTAFQMIEEKIRVNTQLVLEEAAKKRVPPRETAVALAEQRVQKAMTYRRTS